MASDGDSVPSSPLSLDMQDGKNLNNYEKNIAVMVQQWNHELSVLLDI
jgi:hypothetical protein